VRGGKVKIRVRNRGGSWGLGVRVWRCQPDGWVVRGRVRVEHRVHGGRAGISSRLLCSSCLCVAADQVKDEHHLRVGSSFRVKTKVRTVNWGEEGPERAAHAPDVG
jgi:hypothetical protein